MRYSLTVTEIEQWIDNDEGLYLMWRRSHSPKRVFIRHNRDELETAIMAVINKPPAARTWRDYR